MNSFQSDVQCHYCFQIFSKKKPAIFLAKCCKKRCYKYYCMLCINNKFDQMFEQYSYRKDTWICYSCQHLCDCSLCQGIDLSNKRNKKIKTQRGIKNTNKDEQEYYCSVKINNNKINDQSIHQTQSNTVIINPIFSSSFSDSGVNRTNFMGENRKNMRDKSKQIPNKKSQKLVDLHTNKNKSNNNEIPCFLQKYIHRKGILFKNYQNQNQHYQIQQQKQIYQSNKLNFSPKIKEQIVYTIKKQENSRQENNLKDIIKNTLRKYQDINEQEIEIISD